MQFVGCLWLRLCHRNSEIVWPPLVSVTAWNLMLLHPSPSCSQSPPPLFVEQFGLDWISPASACLSVSALCLLNCLFPSFCSNRLQRLRLREAHQRQVHSGLLVPSVIHVQELHHGDDLPQQYWVSRQDSDHSHAPTWVYIILFAFKWQSIGYFVQCERLQQITAGLYSVLFYLFFLTC